MRLPISLCFVLSITGALADERKPIRPLPKRDPDGTRNVKKGYSTVASEAVQPVSNVPELTPQLFDKYVKKSKYGFFFIHFGMPGRHRAELVAFHKVADYILQERPEIDIKFGMLDCAPCLEFCNRFHITTYPFFAFLVGGQRTTNAQYGGKPHFEPLKHFVLKKLEPPLTKVDTIESAKKLTTAYGGTVVIAFYQDMECNEVKELEKYANVQDDMLYLITKADVLYKKFNRTKDGLVLIKSYDDKINHLKSGNINNKTLNEFFTKYRARMIIDVIPQNYILMIEPPVMKNVFLFIDKNHTDYKKIRRSLYSAALFMRGKVRCGVVDINIPEMDRLMSYFGATVDNVPALRAATVHDYGVKYKLDVPHTKWNKKVIIDFMQKLYDNKLKRFMLSEEIPEGWDKEVIKILVGKNFEEFVKDKTKDVFVYFHNNWCQFCERAETGWNATAEKFKDRKDLVFARIDDHKNNLYGIVNAHHPAFLFFPKNSDKYVRYDKEPTLESFTSFINNNEKQLPDVSQNDLDDDDEEVKEKPKDKRKSKDEL